MGSDGEDLENLFEEYENTENDREAIVNTEDAQDTGESSGVRIPVPKRIIKNPRLKFNAERLCGERGIPVLIDHFKNVKFKGIGHEKEDLDKLLTKLEHWTHRLFPSMKFEDCLHHIEKLGKKRPVQTCLRKMRLNMPILNSDFINENEDDVHRVEDSEPIEEVDAFDRLIGESQDISNPNTSESYSMYSSPVQKYGMGQVLGSESGSSLTDEQRERMERNRMLAAERRKARLASLQHNSSDIQSANEEIIPSQSTSNIQEEPFEFLLRNEENIPDTSCDLFSKYSSDKLNVEKSPSKLFNQNSENLGLDDLVDLVDEEKFVSAKNITTFSSEEHKTLFNIVDKSDNFSHDIEKNNFLEQNASVSVSNNTNSEMIISENEENLGIESLLDLVNEKSADI